MHDGKPTTAELAFLGRELELGEKAKFMSVAAVTRSGTNELEWEFEQAGPAL